MQLIATVISTRSLGYYVDIVTDGTLFIGAFSVRGGGADFIPGTGSRSFADTLAYIETQLLGTTGRDRADELRELIDEAAEALREGGCEEHAHFNRQAALQRLAQMQAELTELVEEGV